MVGWEKFTLKAGRCRAQQSPGVLLLLTMTQIHSVLLIVFNIETRGKYNLLKYYLPFLVAVTFSSFQAVELSIRAHEEKRIWLIWMDIFKSVKHLSTKANKARQTALRCTSWQQIKQCWTDYRLLSNMDLFYQTKAETNVLRCSWETCLIPMLNTTMQQLSST